MSGFITTRDLLIHSGMIVREFGPRCFVHCVWRLVTTTRTLTFLECVAESERTLAAC